MSVKSDSRYISIQYGLDFGKGYTRTLNNESFGSLLKATPTGQLPVIDRRNGKSTLRFKDNVISISLKTAPFKPSTFQFKFGIDCIVICSQDECVNEKNKNHKISRKINRKYLLPKSYDLVNYKHKFDEENLYVTVTVKNVSMEFFCFDNESNVFKRSKNEIFSSQQMPLKYPKSVKKSIFERRDDKSDRSRSLPIKIIQDKSTAVTQINYGDLFEDFIGSKKFISSETSQSVQSEISNEGKNKESDLSEKALFVKEIEEGRKAITATEEVMNLLNHRWLVDSKSSFFERNLKSNISKETAERVSQYAKETLKLKLEEANLKISNTKSTTKETSSSVNAIHNRFDPAFAQTGRTTSCYFSPSTVSAKTTQKQTPQKQLVISPITDDLAKIPENETVEHAEEIRLDAETTNEETENEEARCPHH